MSYHLITGATGLLGSYLLRDGLCAGARMAAIVRPKKSVSAQQRINAIAASFQGHGRIHGNRSQSARPVVLSGDLTQADLDLDSPSVAWIARHCKAVIHNAASLKFQGAHRSDDPWRTNVEAAWDTLPADYDERFRRMWRYYLAASMASFRARRIQLWQLVLSPRGVPGGYIAPR